MLLSIRGKLTVRRLVLYFFNLYLITGASSFQPQEVATVQNAAYELVSPHKRHGEATYECIDLTTNTNPAYGQIK